MLDVETAEPEEEFPKIVPVEELEVLWLTLAKLVLLFRTKLYTTKSIITDKDKNNFFIIV